MMQLEPERLRIVDSQLKYGLSKELKREVDAGLETVANNTFEELKNNKTNPTACWRVAVALMNNIEKARGPFFCVLPSRYSEKSYLERDMHWH